MACQVDVKPELPSSVRSRGIADIESNEKTILHSAINKTF